MNFDGGTTEDDYDIISIDDYVGSYDVPEELYKIHLEKDPEKKKQWFKDQGYKSKDSKWKKHMKPFESFKKY